MKKVILALALLAAVPAFAQHHGHHGHHGHGGYRGNGWGNVLGGAILGAVIYDVYNRPVIIQQQPVIVQNPPVIYQSSINCTAWFETMQPDGTITRTRTCNQ